MIFGLYEKVLTKGIESELKNLENIDIRTIDQSELPQILSIAYQKAIRKLLSDVVANEGLERLNTVIQNINQSIQMEDFLKRDEKFVELLSTHNENEVYDNLNKHRPKTSLATSTLFTGNSKPTLESELKKEIRTADEIYFLISFIKFSGLRLIYDDLEYFTSQGKKLKIITTSYMGASDYKAILKLSQLPNTEVKISYDTRRTRLHAKAYYFKRNTGFSTAYIGSSNLSNPALSDGLEWNIKLSEYTSEDVVNNFIKNFETYWNDEEFTIFDSDNVTDKKELKTALSNNDKVESDMIFFELAPFPHQKIILEELEVERKDRGFFKNLVVAATGTGKTMIAAFDYKRYVVNSNKKLLFLAHRKEILEQSLNAFRHVLKDQNFGELWVGGQQPQDYQHLFASIQTLNSDEKYKQFSPDYFDYIVLDESHHASADTYFNILSYFDPEILLGLTATPERMDGKDILEYFDHRIASEVRLTDAINRKLLSPFHYFGVSDPVSLEGLKWQRGRYEISELENVYTKSKQRVQVILDAMEKYLTDMTNFKALGFCVSVRHADFMANSFQSVGIPSIALHAQSSEEERRTVKQKLMSGEIKCIFAVDLFNEGVDIPEIDTVLFLRPTESLTIFTQQLGRGLRLSENKDALTVLDFVGQAHQNYDFSAKYRVLIGKTRKNIKDEIEDEFPNLPAGSHIKLEKVAQEYVLNNIQSSTFNRGSLKKMILNFSMNFDKKLSLENFLELYNIDQAKFYARYSFYELLYETGLKEDYIAKNKNDLKSALRRFSLINSKGLLNFAIKIFTEDVPLESLTNEEKKMLGMLHYTIWGNVAEKNYNSSLKKLKQDNKDIVEEMIDIAEFNLKHLKVLELPYEDKRVPLDIYAKYTTDQIMVAFDKTTEAYKYPLREGVIYIEDYHTDILFITINKSESDYLPSTMYNDYAKNSRYFNWESQSRTTINSPTGQRYIKDRSPEHKVLLFVRSNKTEYNHAAPYIFLGNAKYYSHQGEKPIQIVWEMEHLIPESIIVESDLRVVN